MANRSRRRPAHRLVTIVAVALAGGLAGFGLHLAQNGGKGRSRSGSSQPPTAASNSPQMGIPFFGGTAEKDPEASLAPTVLLEGTQDVPVLMYHDITDNASVYFDISTREFRKQLRQIKESGATVIPLADLYDHLRHGKRIPARSVVLTFDDGYLGQYTNAYPLLKQFGFPATFFVPSGTVGVKTGKDHLTWEQLQELDKEKLISIECHTISHPDDLRKLDDVHVERELKDSKRKLEERLGHPMRFLAYPVGNADARVARIARQAGYDMAFTMGPDWARSPADSFFVPRFLPRYLPEITERVHSGELSARILPTVVDLKEGAVETGEVEDGIVHLKWVRGGRLVGARLMGRRHVPDLVAASGATGGLNGTFFSDARVNSVGSGIVGPVTSRIGPGFAPGLPGDRDRIAGRPLVLISPEKMAFLPFSRNLALDAEGVQRLLPGATDAFVAGAWLVHKGQALTHEELDAFRLSNVFDFRPRAFFGVDRDGKPFLGASSSGNMSDRLALTLAKEGLQECILLDSGFSTSLVYNGEVLVSGIRRDDMPARPVPHVLLMYPVDEKSGTEKLIGSTDEPDLIGPPNDPSPDRLQREIIGPPKVEPAEGDDHRSRPRRRGHHRPRKHRSR